ncbi:hypothetical protein ACEQPO_28990 [Bacillus sp. SL00103]
MGIPLPIVAGAVLSGAYFGDKLSPLSDRVRCSLPHFQKWTCSHMLELMMVLSIPALLLLP